jgi:serine/threonine protein phosphatase PrpC
MAVRSERGQRGENQDNYLIIDRQGQAEHLRDGRPWRCQVKHWPRGCWRLCLVDGMGGHQGGKAFAAEAIEQLLAEPLAPRNPCRHRQRMWALHERLHARHYRGPESPGSTLLWADIRPSGRLRLLHLGDSRAWLRRNGEWQRLTHDHNEAEFLLRDGDPMRLDAPERSMVQALGYGSYGLLRDQDGDKPACASERLRIDLESELPEELQHHADLKTLQLHRGDRLLLASDGLWSGEAGEGWQAWLDAHAENGQDSAIGDQVRNLLWDALERGADDNLTAILCDL